MSILLNDPRLDEAPASASACVSGSKSESAIQPIVENVVIVMHAFENFSVEPLRWALEDVSVPDCVVTLFGVMPWLPARSKLLHLHLCL